MLDRRRWSEKHRSNTEILTLVRDRVNERKRQQKLSAGYVLLIVCLLLPSF
jgi:hypothetical protein